MPGSLTIAGSGIASVAHITLETLAHIKEADKVYYVVADPATEAFIQANATGPCKDLYGLYGSDKPRYDTYVQMAETMLEDVRAGQNVLGIFYGHPGVFVNPSHRALAIAREEGFPAKVLPGVSAEDYMFADLEFDPAVSGCASYEATDLLLRYVPLNTTANNIIWQVGGVGVTTAKFDNGRFQVLVDRLEKDFGANHEVVHYIGGVLPQSETVMDTFTIADLRTEEVAKQFTPCSTLYIPPLPATPTINHAAAQALLDDVPENIRLNLFQGRKWSGQPAQIPAYGAHERAAVAALADARPPASYRPLMASPAMRHTMTELALNPVLRKRYRADPAAYAHTTEGLTDLERAALSMGTAGPIFAAMKPLPGAEAHTPETVKVASAPVGSQGVMVLAAVFSSVIV